MKKLKIGKSNIHGKGLFSGEPIKKGELIAKVHNGIQIDPENVKYMPTQYGRFYNHDEKGFNTRNEVIGNHRYLRALKNIPANTELTANYMDNPEMEQPEDFGSGKYASFDFDKTIATDDGLAKARQMIRDGYNLFIVSARDKVTPDMVARARKAGIPEENIIATGSDEAKIRKVKQLGVEKHFDDKPEVIAALGAVGEQFKKGGGVNSKKYTRSIFGKNKLFVKNKLFKTKKVKNRIYDPNAKYFQNGGATSPEQWGEEIRAIESQIGNPNKWSLADYNLLQDKLDAYRNWRETTPEGQAVEDSHNTIGEYFVPIPKHLNPNRTKLSKEEEQDFQNFYQTLPDNLMQDDVTYDIRGYWDGLGRPEAFDYSQPKESDGYYHAFSINPNTGEYLKSPTHETFQHAVDEDIKIGYRPIQNVYGRNIATYNESIITPEEQSFLRNMVGPVSYQNGGDISIPELNQFNNGGSMGYELGDEVDETTMRKLKKLGYTFKKL